MRLTKRSVWVLPLVVLSCALAGSSAGPRVEAAASPSAAADDGAGSVAGFVKVYTLLEQNFADPIDVDKAIYKGAIPGMLLTLDPHSNFFDPRDYRLFLEEQKGHYYGVGMRVAARNGRTVVLYPLPGAPAHKAGVRPGDVITKIGDKSTVNMSTTDVADLLKGPRGTPVTFEVSREGVDAPIPFTLTRDEVHQASVEEGFWLEPGIAYVKILSFGENTSRELEDTLRRLGEANIKGLVLDLRDNPGGLLNEAVAVADHFLRKNQVVVSQGGRSSPERPYVARTGNRGRDYAIVALVNRSSASAAEILSGALQDHDRAWILGETTFGKGLVQTVFPLAENTALALTTAHFYTPSGRLIQRDYTNLSFYDYYNHKGPNSRNLNDVKTTDSGRTVYGGGGITPDEKYETPKLDPLETALYVDGLFNFTRSYFASHSAALPKGWMPDADVIEDLHDYELKRGTKFSEAEFTADYDWIRRSLAKEIYTTAFDWDAANQLSAEIDPEVRRAVDAMPKAATLLESARKTVAERAAPPPSLIPAVAAAAGAK
ncbi:MAG: S41 family peptidase [Bryobacteraceae bacterium]|jgi:carboxyl-terminal processing protease